MNDFGNKLYSQTRSFIGKYVVFIFLFFGLGLMVAGNIWSTYLVGTEKDVHYIQEFFIKTFESIGSTVLAAGVFSAIAKSSLFIGIFQDILEKIIWSKEFLRTRRDLRKIWGNVSRILYEEKFIDISEEIEQVIMDKYFPIGHSYYYDKFNFIVEMGIDQADCITYNEVITFTAKPSTENVEFDYGFSSTIPKIAGGNIEFIVKKVSINGKALNVNNYLSIDNSKITEEIHNFTCKLKGEKKYDVVVERHKKIPYQTNQSKVYYAKCIYKGFTFQIRYPDSISVSFQEMGTVEKFVKISENTQNGFTLLIMHYPGIIFPKQGIVCFFHKN